MLEPAQEAPITRAPPARCRHFRNRAIAPRAPKLGSVATRRLKAQVILVLVLFAMSKGLVVVVTGANGYVKCVFSSDLSSDNHSAGVSASEYATGCSSSYLRHSLLMPNLSSTREKAEHTPMRHATLRTSTTFLRSKASPSSWHAATPSALAAPARNCSRSWTSTSRNFHRDQGTWSMRRCFGKTCG